MAECPECGSKVNSPGLQCPDCRNPDVTHEPDHENQSDRNNEARPIRPIRRQSQWSSVIPAFLVTYIIIWVLIASFADHIIGFALTIVLILIGLPLSYAIHHDAKAMRDEYSWPTLRGFQYSLTGLIPIINFFVALGYVLGRWEVTHRETPLFSLKRLRSVQWHPYGVLRSLYTGLGVFLTTFLLSFIFLGYPYQFIPDTLSVIQNSMVVLVLILPIVALGMQRYASPKSTKILNSFLRDVSIRLVSIIGVTIFATLLLLALAMPGGVAIAATEYIFGEQVSEALTDAISFPIVVMPLAVIFVLILRTLPWIRSATYAIRTVGAWAANAITKATSAQTQNPVPNSDVAFIPMRGHDHTNLQLQSATDIEMSGIYGYTSKSVDEINTSTLRSSWRRGLIMLIPGYLLAVGMYTYFQLFPERAANYASMFPAEDILVASLSFAGVPRTAIVQAIQVLQIPPETLSMGFLGMAIPAVIMIPGAWHLALEYEGYLYRFLQRLGNDNHLLLLWGIHLLPVIPLVVAYQWLKKRHWKPEIPTIRG